MHGEQAGQAIRRTRVVRKPRPEQPPDVVREMGGLQGRDPLLQHRPQERIGAGDPLLQAAGRNTSAAISWSNRTGARKCRRNGSASAGPARGSSTSLGAQPSRAAPAGR